jgi:6-phosphogluconolactonase
MTAETRIRVFAPGKDWVQGAVKMILDALHTSGSHTRLVLSGGNTPAALYQELSSPVVKSHVDWRRVRLTFSDERTVPPDHPDSNYRMARETLLDPLGIPEHRVIRLRGEDPAPAAAVKAHASLVRWAQRVPLFDVVLLGLGEDGHVASLFPGTPWPDWGLRLAAATRHPDGADRITLTPHALCSTRNTFLLVAGESKADAVRDALTAPAPTPERPATMVGAPVVWVLDEEAASRLPEDLRRTAERS